MVYKKYITRGGKTYGPYIYHSKRVDGKVVSEYHGPKEDINYKKYVWIFLGVFILLAVFFLFFSGKGITGNVALDLQADYNEGESLDGILKFSLKEGELIPASTKLVFENSGNSYEYFLSDILSENTIEGDFYIEGKNIVGKGSGYGKEGISRNQHILSFILDIYSSNDTSQGAEISGEIVKIETQNESVQVVEEVVESVIVPEEIVEETPIVEEEVIVDEQVVEENIPAPITGNSIFKWRGTGNVILELDNEIKGEVSFGNSFLYNLLEGQTAELRSKSVKDGSEILSDNVLDINIENNEVVITTDYSVKEFGFGKDYIGDNLETFTIQLSDLGLVFEEGELKISLIYSDEEILSIKTILEDDSVVEGQVVTEPKVEETQVVEEISKETPTNKVVSDISLTEQEKQILLDEFGTISVDTIRSERIENKIVVGYKIGGYIIEYVYDYDINPEVIKVQADADKIKWIKEIVQQLISKENIVKETYEI